MSFKIDTNRQRSVCFDKQSTFNRNADQTIALKSSSSNQTFSNALNASNFKAISKKSISNHDIFTLRKHQTKSIFRTDNSRRNAESCVCRLCVGPSFLRILLGRTVAIDPGARRSPLFRLSIGPVEMISHPESEIWIWIWNRLHSMRADALALCCDRSSRRIDALSKWKFLFSLFDKGPAVGSWKSRQITEWDFNLEKFKAIDRLRQKPLHKSLRTTILRPPHDDELCKPFFFFFLISRHPSHMVADLNIH